MHTFLAFTIAMITNASEKTEKNFRLCILIPGKALENEDGQNLNKFI